VLPFTGAEVGRIFEVGAAAAVVGAGLQVAAHKRRAVYGGSVPADDATGNGGTATTPETGPPDTEG
jgi:hypothetical protein